MKIDISIIWLILFIATLVADLRSGYKESNRRKRIRKMRHRRGLQ